MDENKHTISDLYQMQALPLSAKIRMTERRIMDWIDYYGTNGVYISFSGGKDSTVLMDIVRNRLGYKDIPAVFVDVPTQYPELKEFALTWDNVEVLKPKISFAQVCEKYGFPLISKEVSEIVSGSRKYLTKFMERESVLTDRQTDRQTYRQTDIQQGLCAKCKVHGNFNWNKRREGQQKGMHKEGGRIDDSRRGEFP